MLEQLGHVALYIGVIDAAVLLLMGVISAVLILAGVDADLFWKRIWPAVGILMGTSVAAVLILLATRWMSNILS